MTNAAAMTARRMAAVADAAPVAQARERQGEIVVSGVSHRYGGMLALDGIDLRFESGKFVVLVGPSGCGKSSLLMMLGGLGQPTEGTISCAGRPW